MKFMKLRQMELAPEFPGSLELPRHAEKSPPPFRVALIDASRVVFIGHQSQPATSALLLLISLFSLSLCYLSVHL